MTAVRRSHWVLLAVAVVVGMGPSSVLVRYAQAEHVPSLVISLYRLVFATLMLAPFAFGLRGAELRAVTVREHMSLAGVGFLLAAHFATWVTSLAYTSVASSAVLVTTEALWVPLGAAYLLRERVGARVWAGVLVAFLGSLVLVLGDRGETRFGADAIVGDGLAFAGALAASLYFLAGRHLRQRHSLLVYGTLVYAWSALFLLAMALARGERLAGYSTRGVGFVFLFALLPMIIGHTTVNYLLEWVPPHYVSTAILGEPVVSAALAFLLLGEGAHAAVLGGGALILAGILVATLRAPDADDAAPVAPPD